jgi:A/G-specific adenine glycosylase
MVATQWGGQFFSNNRHANSLTDFRALPGVGPYTAGAIAAIAFGQQAVVVDGNIERLFSRYFAITTPLPAAKTEIAAAYQAILPTDRPSDWPQALMDFANAVCTSKQPLCDGCFFAESCQALARGLVDQLPVKPVKTPKPVRRAIAFVAVNDQGKIFLHRRPDKGLLGGMLAFPETGLASKQANQNLDQTMAPFAADWVLLNEPVLHVFTHFALEMKICLACIEGTPQPIADDIKGHWAKPRPADLPSLMRKIWKAAAAMPMKPGSSR